jgi:DNA-binding NarL/FixJ family response regulator
MEAGVNRQVLLVDDHPLFRNGLSQTLAMKRPKLVVVGDTGDARSALAIARDVAFDLAICDVMLPEMTGVSLASELRELQPDCQVLALSMCDEPVMVAQVLRAGATGYAIKTQSIDEILHAIDEVLGGNLYVPPGIPRNFIDAALREVPGSPIERLTKREREVFELVIRGETNDSIATRLFIARRTVETHRQRIMHKLVAKNLVDMIRIAAAHGILTRPE